MEIGFDSLSPQEQDACDSERAIDARAGIGFLPTDAYRNGYRAGWVASKLWTIDHLVAMSADQPQAILDVATAQRPDPLPLDIWNTLRAALLAYQALEPPFPTTSSARSIALALSWLSFRRP